MFPHHSTGVWSLAVSGFCVGGFVGSATAGRVADDHGRKIGIAVVLGLNLVFGLVTLIAPNMGVLIVARIGVGIAGGAATVLTPLYLSEIAPTEIKGSIGTLTQLSCVLGILGSVVYALPFCTEELWRWIFVPLPVTSLVGIVVGHYWLPESPKWLLLHHYETRGDDARTIIRQFRNLQQSEQDEEAVEMEVLLMTNHGSSNSAATTQEQPQEDTTTNTTPATSSSSSFKDYVQDPANRIPLVSAIFFPVAQQLSGINAVFYYSTLFFDGVLANPIHGTILAFAVNVVATLVACACMDRLGRKTLLSISAGGMAVCCIFLTIALEGTLLPPIVTVVCVLVYISFFELGLGCIPFFLASELIEPQFLGRIQSVSMASNWGSNFCVGLLFPYMDKFLGAYSFVPFGIVLVGTLWYAVWILPETRGKSLEMVLEELRANRPELVAQEEPEDTPLGGEAAPTEESSTLNRVV